MIDVLILSLRPKQKIKKGKKNLIISREKKFLIFRINSSDNINVSSIFSFSFVSFRLVSYRLYLPYNHRYSIKNYNRKIYTKEDSHSPGFARIRSLVFDRYSTRNRDDFRSVSFYVGHQHRSFRFEVFLSGCRRETLHLLLEWENSGSRREREN